MTLTLTADPLPLRLDSGNTYRVGQTRVRLDTVVFAYNSGASAEQIAHDYPGLELADVHSVIAYYLHHKADVDAYLKQREREAEELRQQLEAEGHVLSRERTAEIRRRFAEQQNHRA
jgi:uncharacterized protein (DUF433 family)